MTKVEDESDAVTAASGEPEAFRLLVDRYSRRLFRLAYRMTGNVQDAEDLVQETFLRAYRSRDTFQARANFSTWIYRICVNASLDHVRKRRAQPIAETIDDPEGGVQSESLPGDTATPERLLLSQEARRAVEAALASLSPVERAAFALRHYEQLSISEIGAALGLREAATKNTIFRGVQKLRRSLQPLHGGSR